jgi:pimeloyl-ACP methyl ester carboxylesterase
VATSDRFLALDGLRLHYRETGDPTAHPVVLLHALFAGGADWDGVASSLADRHRVLAPDLRGSHESGRTERYSYELMRDDIKGLADELGLERFSLIGHSMGGAVAGLFAEEWPDRLDRLVLEDSAPPPPVDRPAPRPTPPADLPPDLPFDVAMAMAILEQVANPNPVWWERLRDITAPTLVIAGGRESHVPQDVLAEVAKRIPNGRLLELGGGHSVHTNRPAEFVAAVREFLP